MLKYRLSSLMLASLVGLTACGGSDNKNTTSTNEPANKTFVIFEPLAGQVPVPSDLQFSAETAGDGTMYAGDDDNPVISGIDALDGNSILAPFDIQFSGSLNTAQTLDAASFITQGTSIIPNPNQNVFLLPLTYPGGNPIMRATVQGVSAEVPTFSEALAYQGAAAAGDVATLSALAMPTARAEIISLDGGTDNVLRILPVKPLAPKTRYLVVLTNIEDSSGNLAFQSKPYEELKNPDTDFSLSGGSGPRIESLGQTVLSWEQLAAGYFGFMQSVYDAASISLTAPSADDIIFTMTFTTGGTTDVLTSIAAPESFFDTSARLSYKREAIEKLVMGTYNVQGDNSALTDATDIGINTTLNILLTSQTIPNTTQPNPLYSATIAQAIGAGADYATIATSASAAYIMQRAAGEAAISVRDTGGAIATVAAGTVQSFMGAGVDFGNPQSRTTNFFYSQAASEINAVLAAPAVVYHGEITLPLYQTPPTDSDGSPLVTSRWQANTTLGGFIDNAAENLPGTTPPSSMVTYHYPFPQKQTDITSPLMVVTPSSAAVAAAGITPPADGWPVVIFQHGINVERSTALPLANVLASACYTTGPNSTLVPTGAPCFATVAIDRYLHGVAPGGSVVPGLSSATDPDFTQPTNIGDNTPSANLTERHFDYTSNAANQPTPMLYDTDFGSSGSLFINLNSFTTARDNLRQTTLDLLNVAASLDDMDLNDDGTADELDTNNVYFIGHSLGGIDGLPFVAVNNSAAVQNSAFSDQPWVHAAVGITTGGGAVRLLTNSQSFGGPILSGLQTANAALTQGLSGLESYLNVFQGVLDSADVMSFASHLSDANSSTGVLLFEVPNDVVIPNAADDIWGTGPLVTTIPETGFMVNNLPAPLAGTEPLIAQFGAVKTGDVTSSDGDADVVVTRFTAGTHSTPVSADDPAVFAELAGEIVAFFARNGVLSSSIVTNPAVVEE